MSDVVRDDGAENAFVQLALRKITDTNSGEHNNRAAQWEKLFSLDETQYNALLGFKNTVKNRLENFKSEKPEEIKPEEIKDLIKGLFSQAPEDVPVAIVSVLQIAFSSEIDNIKNVEDSYFKDCKTSRVKYLCDRLDTLLPKCYSESPLWRYAQDMLNARFGDFGSWMTNVNFNDEDLETVKDEINKLEKAWFGTELDLSAAGYESYESYKDDLKTVVKQVFKSINADDDNRAQLDQVRKADNREVVNSRFMFVFGNWGVFPLLVDKDSTDPMANEPKRYPGSHAWCYYPSGDKNTDQDWSKRPFSDDFKNIHFPLTFADFHYPLCPQFAAYRQLQARCDKASGKEMAAVMGTPMYGAYETDFVKGIASGTLDKLNAAMSNGSRGGIHDLMWQILEQELCVLEQGNKGNEGQTLLMLTTEPFDAVKKTCDPKAWAWRVIRWPHHSDSGNSTFKATTLAYAYGRVARALVQVDGFDQSEDPDTYFDSHEWPWPFRMPARLREDLKLRDDDSLPSLFVWLVEGFGAKSAIFDEYLYPQLARKKDKPVKLPKTSKKKDKNGESMTSFAQCAAEAKRCPDKSAVEIVEEFVVDADRDDEVRKEWKQLAGSYKGRKPSTTDVINRIYAKKTTDKTTCDIAFMLGWYSEKLLLDQRGKCDKPESPGVFDNTLLPPWDVLEQLKAAKCADIQKKAEELLSPQTSSIQ